MLWEQPPRPFMRVGDNDARAAAGARTPCARLDPKRRAWRAAYGLLADRPLASAAGKRRLHRALWAGPITFMAGLCVLAPSLAGVAFIGLTGLAFAGLAAMRLASALIPPRLSPRRAVPASRLPFATVIAALHDEADVVEGLVKSLSRLDYPPGRLEIILAIEADDAATLAAARRAAARAPLSIRVAAVPDTGPRTKPKALNYALAEAKGGMIAIYDAEDAPHPAQLRAAAEAFAADARLACVQAPLNWYNREDNWLTRMFALEYAAQFNALLPLFLRLGWPLPLGGTSNVFRRDALEAVGAWDPFNVTEDADLGFRLARYGWRTGLIAPGTLEEAPVSLSAWSAQRSRWLKGHAVSLGVQLRDPAGLIEGAGRGAMAALVFSLGANVICALAHLPAALWVAWAVIGETSLWPILPVALGYGAGIAAALAGARRAGVKARARHLIALPLYWVLQTGPVWRALRELARDPYFWSKTRHGVTARRRTAPDEHDMDADADGRRDRDVRAGGVAQRAALRPGARPAPDPVDGDRDPVGGVPLDPARPPVQLFRDRDRGKDAALERNR